MEAERVVEPTTSAPEVPTEKETQQAIERAKNHVQTADVVDALVLEFDCEHLESTKFHLSKGNIEFDIDLYDYNGIQQAFDQAVKLRDNEKAYLPLVVLTYAGKRRTFIPGLYRTEDDAKDALPGGGDPPAELPFKFASGSSETIWYGPMTSIRRRLPDSLERLLNNEWLILSLMFASIVPGAFFHPGLLALAAAGMMGTLWFARYEQSAEAFQAVDLSDVYAQASGEREFEVVTCEFEATADRIWIRDPERNAEWTYEKNAVGELEDVGKEALDAVSLEGDECIACVSRARIDEVNRLESDCGEWKLEDVQ